MREKEYKVVKKVKLSKLVLDDKLYPRAHIEPYHVGELVEAIKAGAQLPPIVADKATLKVTDGRHRIEAIRTLEGDKAMVDVDLKEYASEAAMFEDAIRLNASHGRSLSKMDQAHCLAKAQEFKLEPAVVATLLNITQERAEDLVSNRLAFSGEEQVVLKGSTAWLAGRHLSEEQAHYNRGAGGMNQTFYINQVIGMLEGDAVDWENARVAGALKKLLGLLEENLKVKA